MGSTTTRECLATLNWTVPFPGSAATHYELDFGLALHPILDPYGLVVLTVSAGALTVASQSSKLSGSALSYLLAIFSIRSGCSALPPQHFQDLIDRSECQQVHHLFLNFFLERLPDEFLQP